MTLIIYVSDLQSSSPLPGPIPTLKSLSELLKLLSLSPKRMSMLLLGPSRPMRVGRAPLEVAADTVAAALRIHPVVGRLREVAVPGLLLGAAVDEPTTDPGWTPLSAVVLCSIKSSSRMSGISESRPKAASRDSPLPI